MNKYLEKFNIKFYKSKEWKQKRKEILIRDNFECQMCKKFGRVTTQEMLKLNDQYLTVHHIKHYNKFPQLALNDENLITLCPACHNRVHPEKAFTNKKNIIHEERFE